MASGAAKAGRRLVGWLVFLGLIAGAYFYGRDYVRRHPEDFPWTELRLEQPIGVFTLRKLASLADQPAQCRALLRGADARDIPAPPRLAGPNCGYEDGMQLGRGAGEPRFSPGGVVTSCPVAAALSVFERQGLQPAARRRLGSEVAEGLHAGSYSCRRLY